ncbi:hypothetical protein E3P96_02235 [Wallemia ichthyophaga]|nr:hypothetical protein E3P96_02235 [Wallemia ichthyophaga]
MKETNKNKIQQFSPLRLQIYKEFWHALSSFKLNTQRLDDAPIPVHAGFNAGRAIIDNNTGDVIDTPASLLLDGLGGVDGVPLSYAAHGHVHNMNTIEDFKRCDKTALFNSTLDSIKLAKSVDDLIRFLLISFSDMKKFTFHYLAATPAVIDGGAPWLGSMAGCDAALAREIQSVQPAGQWCWIVRRADDGVLSGASVDEWEVFHRDTHSQSHTHNHTPTIAFIDPSSGHAPGWPLRNLLYYICTRFGARKVDVFASRNTHSLYGTLTTDARAYEQVSGVGWEKNSSTHKISPQTIDLSASLDPTKLADQAVELNLKLMKWRILPSLDLDVIGGQRCLLLGAGTLGCYVARGLMAWGVRHITLVDSGTVSYSNPVRQPLFEFEDCAEGGKPKAECAAERLRRIYPGVQACGVQLSIPMPGHPFPTSSKARVESEVHRLDALIDQHDSIFLLTDSRESRWLPTLLGKARNKTVINAALGFDSYLVMRHGTPVNKLGCYYCNDIVAPTDSLSDRTLDQMCTVTRPGVAPIAAATAVEMLTSLLQHPQQKHVGSTRAGGDHVHTDESLLGVTPHQIRGQLGRFDNVQITGMAFDRCTACSDVIQDAYHTQGMEMISRAINDSDYLVNISGLSDLYKASEDAIKDITIESEDEF